MGPVLTMCSCFQVQFDEISLFLPTPPPRGAWVFRWTFLSLPPLPLPHLQSFVSLRYRTFLLGTENAMGGDVGLWQCMPSCFHCKYCANEIILPSVHTATSALTAVGKGLETHCSALLFLSNEKFIGNIKQFPRKKKQAINF